MNDTFLASLFQKDTKIINALPDSKAASLAAIKNDGDQVLLKFQKEAFPSDDLGELMVVLADEKNIEFPEDHEDEDTEPAKKIQKLNEKLNDVPLKIQERTFKITINSPLINKTKITMVNPATQKIIRKYTKKKFQLVYETAEIYKNVVQPYLSNQVNLNSNSWIHNILDGKAEADRTIFHDKENNETGFLLAYSMNWPGEVENLYLNTLTNDRNILSIRSLRGSNHLKLLKHMKTQTLKICQEKFNLDESKLRIYFHYPPSFYHLHLHIVNVDYFPSSMGVDRAVLLSDVMGNLELDGDYYLKKTMVYKLDEDSELLKLIRAYEEKQSETV